LKNTFNGLFGLLFVMLCTLVVWAEPQTAQAATKSTAQGVRKTTSSPAKKSVGKAKPIALPPEKAADATSKEIAAKATSLVGSRYVWGSATPQRGFDCSGLVQYVYAAKGKSVPRTTQALYQSLSKPKDLQVGDVIFFGPGRVRHVAVYIGNGEIIHASTPSRGVRKDKVQTIARAMGLVGVGRA
jgi:cell wall-associated NlpC family hydrolase